MCVCVCCLPPPPPAPVSGMQAIAVRVSDILVHLYRFLVASATASLRSLKWNLWSALPLTLPATSSSSKNALSAKYKLPHCISRMTMVHGLACPVLSWPGQGFRLHIEANCSAVLSLIKFQIFYQNLRHSFGHVWAIFRLRFHHITCFNNNKNLRLLPALLNRFWPCRIEPQAKFLFVCFFRFLSFSRLKNWQKLSQTTLH